MRKLAIILAAVATMGSAALVSTQASAAPGFMPGFHPGWHHGGHFGGWHGGPGFGFGYGYGYAPTTTYLESDDDCRMVRVHTRFGFRWRQICD